MCFKNFIPKPPKIFTKKTTKLVDKNFPVDVWVIAEVGLVQIFALLDRHRSANFPDWVHAPLGSSDVTSLHAQLGSNERTDGCSARRVVANLNVLHLNTGKQRALTDNRSSYCRGCVPIVNIKIFFSILGLVKKQISYLL